MNDVVVTLAMPQQYIQMDFPLIKSKIILFRAAK
jgi:hypothetical protein